MLAQALVTVLVTVLVRAGNVTERLAAGLMPLLPLLPFALVKRVPWFAYEDQHVTSCVPHTRIAAVVGVSCNPCTWYL